MIRLVRGCGGLAVVEMSVLGKVVVALTWVTLLGISLSLSLSQTLRTHARREEEEKE